MQRPIERAIAILDNMRQENIKNPEHGNYVHSAVNKIRKLSDLIVQDERFPAPGMTAAIACTLLKTGACNELTQRFLSEYLIRYKESNVNLVFLLNSNDYSSDNHVFVIVGNIQCRNELFIGRGEKPTSIAEKRFFLPIEIFIAQQEGQSAIVDPLLDTVTSNNQADRLLAYCRQHGITDVIGVRQYSLQFIEHAGQIKANAIKVAEKILEGFKRQLLLGLSTNNTAIIYETLKGIRTNTALLNHKYVAGMTVLHFAFLHANIELIEQLIKDGASEEITNNAGHTAIDCLGYTESEIIKTLTPIVSGKPQINMQKINLDRQILVGKGHHSPWLFRKEAAEGNLTMVNAIILQAPQYLDAVGLPSKRSALHQAALRGKTEICMRLLDLKAAIDPEDKDGNTPLALTISKDYWDTTAALIQRGANIDHPNQAGITPRSRIQNTDKIDLLKPPLPGDQPSVHVVGSIFYERQGNNAAASCAPGSGKSNQF